MPIDRNQPNWYWGSDKDDEILHGPFETMQEARDDAQSSCDADDCFVDEQDFKYELCLATPMRLFERIFKADQVMEMFYDHNDDHVDYNGELADCDPSEERLLELEYALNGVFSEWRSKHDIGRSHSLDVLERFKEVAPFEPQNPPAT